MKEADLARDVVAYLRGMEADVHQEVAVHRGGRVADIVALTDKTVHVVECKAALSFAVIEQAMYWRYDAHYASIAVPVGKRNAGRGIAFQYLEHLGLGCYEVGYGSVTQQVAPRLNRRKGIGQQVRGACCDETRSGEFAEAGTNRGGYFTPFKNTVKEIQRVLANGELTTRELIGKIEHHYGRDTTARSALLTWAKAGKIPGVELDWSQSPVRWRLKKEAANAA